MMMIMMGNNDHEDDNDDCKRLKWRWNLHIITVHAQRNKYTWNSTT